MTNLLPPNSSPLDRRLSITCSAAEDLSTEVIVDAVRVPTAREDFLPYLAWEASVDRWSDDWSDATKRKVIEDSFFVHKHKGTIGSLRRVVEPFGFLLRVVEWYELEPPAKRGTFKLDIGVSEKGISDEVYAELVRLIDETKPVSRHLTGLAITILAQAESYMGCAAYLGDELTVYPPTTEDITVTTLGTPVGGIHLIDIITVSTK